MIRDRLPRATIITFWHIPWPNPESFSICPWRTELLDGLLGSSILGFHTQFHCNNFLDTVDRLLEARVDRESFTISSRGHSTAVHRYPISIEWPAAPLAVVKSVPDARRAVRERLGLPGNHRLGVGVDRLDYTKGIAERFNAVARLLETHSRWIGRFTFVQIAAPSRGCHRRLSRLRRAGHRARRSDQPALRRGEISADRAHRRAPRGGRRLRVLPGERLLFCQQSSRWHEPRLQGVRVGTR
jgi:trehalose-6-phosphate synthase